MNFLYLLFTLFQLLQAILSQNRNKTAYLLYLLALDQEEGPVVSREKNPEEISHKYSY
jgi:hypothetical protein